MRGDRARFGHHTVTRAGPSSSRDRGVVIGGGTDMYFGARLEQHLVARAGECVSIPADVPRRVSNVPGTHGRAVVVHRSPDDPKRIELLP